jgi:hypothetical protein
MSLKENRPGLATEAESETPSVTAIVPPTGSRIDDARLYLDSVVSA